MTKTGNFAISSYSINETDSVRVILAMRDRGETIDDIRFVIETLGWMGPLRRKVNLEQEACRESEQA